jgi:14-3-3 protein epsilon
MQILSRYTVKLFWLNLRCYRYLAEFKTVTERKDAAENTMVAYKAAQVIFMSSVLQS